MLTLDMMLRRGGLLPPSGASLALKLDGTDSGLTFTRASKAWNPETGLIAPHNLLLQSNGFATTWVQAGTPTPTQNTVDPWYNANNAWTLTDDSASTPEYVYQNNTLTAAPYTYSTYIAKTVGATAYTVIDSYVSASSTSMALVTIDTNNGIITPWTSYTGFTMATNISASISSVGNFWRVSLTKDGTAESHRFELRPAGTTNPTQSTGAFDAVATGSAVFYGAQLEQSSTPGTYVPTTTAAVYTPRYVSGKSGNGILIEQASTNLCTNSDVSLWSKTGTTVTAPSVAGPYGSNVTAYLINEGVANSTHNVNNLITGAANPHTVQLFLKGNGVIPYFEVDGGGGSTVGVAIAADGVVTFNGNDRSISGVASNKVITAYANGWYKVSFTSPSVVTLMYLNYQNASGAPEFSYPGTSRTLYAYLPQVENLAYPTSNIVTAGASATRAAENESSPTAGVVANTGSAVGVWYKPTALTTATKTLWSSYTDASNWTSLEYIHGTGFTATKRVAGVTTLATAAVAASTTAFTHAILGINADKTLSLYVNGVAAGTNTTNTTGTPVVAATMQWGAINNTLQAGGTLDNGRTYNYPITAAQAMQWYRSSK